VSTFLQNELSKALDDADVRAKLANLGCEPFKGSSELLAQIVKDDLPRWAKIVKDSGATVD
jgi:tripartite-type tricarboxylate transporter receptor subunit TctC